MELFWVRETNWEVKKSKDSNISLYQLVTATFKEGIAMQMFVAIGTAGLAAIHSNDWPLREYIHVLCIGKIFGRDWSSTQSLDCGYAPVQHGSRSRTIKISIVEHAIG